MIATQDQQGSSYGLFPINSQGARVKAEEYPVQFNSKELEYVS
jgi:hypothetical protein